MVRDIRELEQGKMDRGVGGTWFHMGRAGKEALRVTVGSSATDGSAEPSPWSGFY